jgi:hypothetical protein
VTMRGCRSCGAPVDREVVDLGAQPLADLLLDPDDLERPEARYPLVVDVCERCWLIQLRDFEGSERILSEHVHASSSFSETLSGHGRSWAKEAVQRLGLGPGSMVAEVASSDGFLLRTFAERGIRVQGIEHVADVADEAIAAGVPTEKAAFDPATARRLADGGLRADLVIGNHNLANAPDLGEAVGAMAAILAPGGTISVEFHHALHLIGQTQFDTICHPHCSYLSLLALSGAMQRNGLAMVEATEEPVHGGSVRVWAMRRGEAPPGGAGVETVLTRERSVGLDSLEAYRGFSARVEAIRRDLLTFLDGARREGRSVAGYGAPVKGNTLLNSCDITRELLPYTVDISPRKQGKFLPGSHLPVHAPARILEDRPDYVLVLPWTLVDEITGQMAEVRSWGGRFVVPIPELRFLD